MMQACGASVQWGGRVELSLFLSHNATALGGNIAETAWNYWQQV